MATPGIGQSEVEQLSSLLHPFRNDVSTFVEIVVR